MPRFHKNADRVKFKGLVELSLSDWDKRMCSVLFTGGCNFRCPYCHNRDLVLNPGSLGDMDYGSIKPYFEGKRLWVDNITISGGEPTLHDGVKAVVADLKMSGFNVKIDTNGSNPEYLGYLIDNNLVDHVAMDLKGPLGAGRYKEFCGVDVPESTITESILRIVQSGVAHQFRTTIVPEMHTEEDIKETSLMLNDVGARCYRLQNFRPVNTLDPSYLEKRGFSQDYFSLLKTKYEIEKPLGRRIKHADNISDGDTHHEVTPPAPCHEEGGSAYPLLQM